MTKASRICNGWSREGAKVEEREDPKEDPEEDPKEATEDAKEDPKEDTNEAAAGDRPPLLVADRENTTDSQED